MQNFSFKRLTAWLLTLMMVFSLVPVSVSADAMDDFLRDITEYHLSQGNYLGAAGANISAAAAGSGSEDVNTDSQTESSAEKPDAVVVAASDFQQRDGHTASDSVMEGIIAAMVNNGVTSVDGAIFCGDYSNDFTTSASNTGLSYVYGNYNGTWGLGYDDIIFVQGNHDPSATYLDKSCANDPESGKYGVFVINEDDYGWASGDYGKTENEIKTTAANLKTYLDAKIAAKFDKPIFVASHLCLHYSMRTYRDGDCRYAQYIFDVLNEASEAGLNIIYLFGHNHSQSFENYHGGGAVFYSEGDSILISDTTSNKTHHTETIKFTYLNAGYTGRFDSTDTADPTNTGTVYQIYSDRVVISRYDANGIHKLKSAGEQSQAYSSDEKNKAKIVVNTRVETSPQTIELKKFDTDTGTDTNENKTVRDETTGITVTAPGLTGITVGVKTVALPEGYSAYASYDINLTGYTDGDTAEVMIPVPAGFAAGKSVVVLHDGAEITTDADLSDGINFTTDHFSIYDVAQIAETAGDGEGEGDGDNEGTGDTGSQGNDYPTYPEGGSVKLTKTAEGQDFQNTGIARVNLSTSGLPAPKGADVIVMLDTSSSMDNELSTSNITRLAALKNSLKTLIQQLQQKREDGSDPDIRIAVTDFNGYNMTNVVNSAYHRNHSVDRIGPSTTGGTDGKNGINAQVFTNVNGSSYAPQDATSATLNATAFQDINTISLGSDYPFDNEIDMHSGTNYDYAFDAIYQLGESILAENKEKGEDRDLFVIFMSDGGPFQYNYFSGNSSNYTPAAGNWNDWLNGTYANVDEVPGSGTHKYFYNGPGNSHRMADAIKGSPNEMYAVIRKDADRDTFIDVTGDGKADDYMIELPGLGATMYSIGFCIVNDNQLLKDTIEYVLKDISTDSSKYYYSVDQGDTLDAAFKAIGSDISYAAQNAYFLDVMGSSFDLRLDPIIRNSFGTVSEISNDIIVTSHPVYTKSQIGDTVDGHIVTADDVGKTYGDGDVLETVKFDSADKATSSKLTDTNIIKDGVICAKTFFYNTTSEDKTITVGGATRTLPPETFYWNIGTINEQQFTLSYTVYLTNSLDDGTEAGSYATNESAILYYTNWLGHEVSQSVSSPTLAWEAANVSYAFYAVNSAGEPVDGNGNKVPNIITAYKVTDPVLYKTVLLNSPGEKVMSTAAAEVLPEGYVLYDDNAVYEVVVNSGDGAGKWEIKGGNSTYVTGYGGAQDYSNASMEDDTSYDYTHTTVYFAVVWTIGAQPDSVVIDYGLPVDISVFVNDSFGGNGKLNGVGKLENMPTGNHTSSSKFGKSLSTDYGTASVNGDKVRYTPSNMKMGTYDKFAYEVEYTVSGDTTNLQYYYSTVTVIPATSIYYEESFLTFTNHKVPQTDADGKNVTDPDGNIVYIETTKTTGNGVWTTVGTETNATQDEDRPGKNNYAFDIDANNIYGYDPAYTNYTEYSLGSARKVTVDAASAGHKDYAPTVSFTFTGKGFDVVSLTDSDAGVIFVTYTNSEGTSKTYFVDNYYGYSYTDGKWVVDENSTDSIYQVPVMKLSVPYGTYDVQIHVIYNEHFEHSGNDSYSFYMDSVRIYDPANDGAANKVIEEAYKADGEYKPDYLLIKKSILSSTDADILLNTDKDDPKNGSVFIDGKDSTNSVSDYENPGPNNEAYLANGQSISFKLTAPSSLKIDKVHLGMKLAFGNLAAVKVTESWLEENETKTSTLLEQNLETATDMYYEMTPTWDGKTTRVITITNTSDAVVSLTNVKLTYKDAGNGSNNTGGAPAAAFLTDREVIDVALYLARDYFIPETFEASVSRSLFGTFEIVKVVTSADAESISINGKTLTTYVPLGEERVWTDIYKKGESEEYEIIAYNADGLASVTITAAYGKTGTSFDDAMKELYDKINSIFGDIGEALGSETAEGAAETMYSVMEKLAERVFQPEFFQCSINRTASGENQLVVNTSDDVAYIVADGEIITRYITETIVDLSEESSETVNRVWLVPNGNETTEITAYNAEGVASETADNN